MDAQTNNRNTCAVFVELRDQTGNTIGRKVFHGWEQSALPAVNDTFLCEVDDISNYETLKVRAKVLQREIDLQTDDNGVQQTLVYLIVQESNSAMEDLSLTASGTQDMRFSDN